MGRGAGFICFAALLICQISLIAPVLRRYTLREKDPFYGYWFVEAYHFSFVRQLSVLSTNFNPQTEAQVDELLSFKAIM
jgi:hypothetical protein